MPSTAQLTGTAGIRTSEYFESGSLEVDLTRAGSETEWKKLPADHLYLISFHLVLVI